MTLVAHKEQAVSELGYIDVLRANFVNELEGDRFTIKRVYTLKSTPERIADVVREALAPVKGEKIGLWDREIAVHHEGVAFTSIEASNRYNDDGEELDMDALRGFSIEVTGAAPSIEKIFATLDAKFKHDQHAKIHWWFRGDTGPTTKVVYLPPLQSKLQPECYPMLDNPQDFLDAYMKSDASILLMAGPPGTGKTTLLRHLICDRKLTAHVIYDERLMDDDKVFQGFLFGDSQIMVIEDADTVLLARDHDNNKMMARFLNVSDGLIKLPNKKLVFTTNINDFGRVDPALLRPGRCFGVLHTRPLNLTEAQAAARVAGLPVPLKGDEFTLAELFNQGTDSVSVRRIGFKA